VNGLRHANDSPSSVSVSVSGNGVQPVMVVANGSLPKSASENENPKMRAMTGAPREEVSVNESVSANESATSR
jgi:hypothetical protein